MPVDLSIPEDVRVQIEREIHSDASPVGIDAQKTHVLILHKLTSIERRLAKLEDSLSRDR